MERYKSNINCCILKMIFFVWNLKPAIEGNFKRTIDEPLILGPVCFG